MLKPVNKFETTLNRATITYNCVNQIPHFNDAIRLHQQIQIVMITYNRTNDFRQAEKHLNKLKNRKAEELRLHKTAQKYYKFFFELQPATQSIFKHLRVSENCRSLCSDDCFKILDRRKQYASTSFQLKIKEALHILWEQPS